jgi:hypothetical protein
VETRDTEAERRLQEEEQALSDRMMLLLTGGITVEGDAFLIAVGAALLMGALYPLVGAWSMLAFPVVLILAVAIRGRRRRGRPRRRRQIG